MICLYLIFLSGKIKWSWNRDQKMVLQGFNLTIMLSYKNRNHQWSLQEQEDCMRFLKMGAIFLKVNMIWWINLEFKTEQWATLYSNNKAIKRKIMIKFKWESEVKIILFKRELDRLPRRLMNRMNKENREENWVKLLRGWKCSSSLNSIEKKKYRKKW